jgi:UDP-glucose 4-epimerase
MRILVTGATGFIGRRLVEELDRRNTKVIALTRNRGTENVLWSKNSIEIRYGDFDNPDTLDGVCKRVDTVLHLAGFAHVDNINGGDAEELHRRVSVDGTRVLLRETVRASVKRFVFISSVKAMGEGGPSCLDEAHVEQPVSAYGRAKLAAEELVLEVGRMHGLHVCNLRLPLVYGRGNKGNIPRMIKAIDHGLFPPLPEFNNKRSMVHVDDVVQAILLAADKPESHGQTYVVTDGHVYTTREIYTMICEMLGKTVPHWTVPLGILRAVALVGDVIGRLRGRSFVFDSQALGKLVCSAWYSSDKITRELGYRPKWILRDALPEMISDYKQMQTKPSDSNPMSITGGRP